MDKKTIMTLFSTVFLYLLSSVFFMAITVIPLGGSQEVGRNCFAVDVSGKIFIFDMGFHLERFIEVTGEDDPHKRHGLRTLVSSGALPDIRLLRKRRNVVVGIFCSHAHIDHIGAIPFLAKKFNCSVYATPFTAQVVRSLCEERGHTPEIVQVQPNSSIKVDGFEVEFLQVAHSTPQTVMIALHTPEGVVLYANDFKKDATPPFEEQTNMARLKELKGKVKLLILDSLYAPKDDYCPSEATARKDVLECEPLLKDKRTIVASTFSSHIYRLVTLCDLADKLNRKVVFLGRSLARYIQAAKEAGVVDLSTRGELIGYSSVMRSFLRRMVHPHEYFIIATGHQGEPNAVLSRLADGLYPFNEFDAVLFSCNVIPVPLSIEHRKILEAKLKQKGVQLFTDVHVSGHAHAKDQEELLRVLQPKFLFPVHADKDMLSSMHELAITVGLDKSHICDLPVGERCRL